MNEPNLIAQNLVKKEGTVPLLSIHAKNTNRLFGKDEIIVLSDLGIHVFNGSGKEKMLFFKWIDIVDFKAIGNTMTISTQNTTISYTSQDLSKITSIIELKIQQLLLPEQLKKISLNYKSKATPLTSLFRCKCISQTIYLKMLHAYTSGENGIISTLDALPQILSVLPIQTFCKSLTIKLIENPSSANITLLRNYLSQDTILEHLHFDGLLPSSFPEIISALEKNQQSKIQALSFSNSGFSQNTITKLIPVINSKIIRSLSFHNAFESGTHILYNDFIPKIRKRPRFLNFADTKGLLLPPLLSSRTVCLSLDRCGIDISDILTSISNASQNLISLHHLSISGCTLAKPLSHIELPQCIHTIYADNVTFSDNLLSSFINALFICCKRGFVLTLREARATQNGWTSADDLFASTNYSRLLGLAWSANPIPPSFFRFLSRQTQLSRLDLSRCPSDARPKESDALLSYLRTSLPSLTSLSIRGLRTAPKLALAVIRLAREMGGVPFVDISESNGGDALCKEIGRFASGGRTRRILFDGARPSAAAIRALGELSRSAFLPPPLTDITSAAADETEAEALRALFTVEMPHDAGFVADSFGADLIPEEYMAGEAIRRVLTETFARSDSPKKVIKKAPKTLEGVEVTFGHKKDPKIEKKKSPKKKHRRALTLGGEENNTDLKTRKGKSMTMDGEEVKTGEKKKNTKRKGRSQTMDGENQNKAEVNKRKEKLKERPVEGPRPVIRALPLPIPVAVGPQTRFIPVVVNAEDVGALLRLSPEAQRVREKTVEPLRRKKRRASSARSTPRAAPATALSELPSPKPRRKHSVATSSTPSAPASEPKRRRRRSEPKTLPGGVDDLKLKIEEMKPQAAQSEVEKPKSTHRVKSKARREPQTLSGVSGSNVQKVTKSEKLEEEITDLSKPKRAHKVKSRANSESANEKKKKKKSRAPSAASEAKAAEVQSIREKSGKRKSRKGIEKGLPFPDMPSFEEPQIVIDWDQINDSFKLMELCKALD